MCGHVNSECERERERERERGGGGGGEREGEGEGERESEEKRRERDVANFPFTPCSRWVFNLIHGTTIGLLVEILARK